MLVTVGITLYNKANQLEGLGSLVDLCQLRDNVEVLIVDDGSTDESVIQIKSLLRGIAQIIVHDCNQGVSAAKNTLLESAKGDYITFVDADDHIDGEMLDKVINELEVGDEVLYDLLLTRYRVISSNGLDITSPTDCKMGSTSKISRLDMLENYLLRPNKDTHLVRCFAKFFRLKFLRNNRCLFNTGLNNFEDVDFVAKVMGFAEQVWMSDIYFYSHHAKSLGTSETCNNSRSLVSHTGYIEAAESVLRTRNKFINDLKLNSLYSDDELRSQIIGAYSCITVVQGCARVHHLGALLNYGREVENLMSLPEVKDAMKNYDYCKAGGSQLLTFLMK